MSLLQPKRLLPRTGANSATEVLRESGLRVTDTTLESAAAAGKGPPYRIINGRAVYLRDELEQWLEEQVRGEPNRAA